MPFVEFPAAAAWPYLIASTLISTAMWLMLNRAYQTSELSLIYPLARGTGPLVTDLLGGHVKLGMSSVTSVSQQIQASAAQFTNMGQILLGLSPHNPRTI